LPRQVIGTEPAPPHDALVLPSDSATSAVQAHAPARPAPPAPPRRGARQASRPPARPKPVIRHVVVTTARPYVRRSAPRPRLVSRPLVPLARPAAPKPEPPSTPRPATSPAPTPTTQPASAPTAAPPAPPAATPVERALQNVTEPVAEPTRHGHVHDKKDKPQRGHGKNEQDVPAAPEPSLPPPATEIEQEPVTQTRDDSDVQATVAEIPEQDEAPPAGDDPGNGHGRGHAWGHEKK
jgi:hypothetical protein